ncbi:MAG: RdgB/HAM1 family non-canonical purine NTP pyrophosphatase [Hormoscilla sp. SP5CHS1]|nr:RdgB/HAM1 family non-canonical purine NTP pyrophosphatase [Hormoscilla sp. SP5CHS1]
MTVLVVATSNLGKVKEMQAYLADLGYKLQLKPKDLEIEETGDTFMANACLKASGVAKVTGQWAIADDSGLAVEALNGAPGIYSARYGSTDDDRISRLLSELSDAANRRAQFVGAIAIARPDGKIALQSEGVCDGEILHLGRGTSGFGYDPIFYLKEQQLTFAEMTTSQKQRYSHRGKALSALRSKLPL